MSNPLLDKYEEIYGEKKEEEVVEEKKPSIDEFRDSFLSGLRGGMADDIITMGGGADTINLNPYDSKPVFTINGGSEITGGDYVIPTATVNNGAMSMDGSYITPNALISNGKTVTSVSAHTPNTFMLPQNTQMDKHLCKVMDDLAKGKAVLSAISAEVDQSFTGFGGQIRYSIEIVGRYP
jgi:hypothetical protein